MHSYIRTTDGGKLKEPVYTVGLWFATGDARDCSFRKLFDVATRDGAIVAVNMLNGGDTSQVVKVIKEH